MLIGCIADDLTGATDLGVTLAREGLSVIQVNGDSGSRVRTAGRRRGRRRAQVADDPRAGGDRAVARRARLAARRTAPSGSTSRYCSTFDSTPQGNIGPVTEALQAALGGALVPATPAYPRNKRTVYLGHLFVGDVLLSDSGMRNHPLTPMTDANLVPRAGGAGDG